MFVLLWQRIDKDPNGAILSIHQKVSFILPGHVHISFQLLALCLEFHQSVVNIVKN
jgi:hypothetical protein